MENKMVANFLRNEIIEINNVIMKINFLLYFHYLFIIFFRIFHIFHIISHFNLLVFPYFPVICPFPGILFSLSISYKLINFYELTLSLVICPFNYSTDFSAISSHYSTNFSSILSKSYLKLNSEMIWKIWKKGKLNSGKIWKMKWWQTFVRNEIIEINNVTKKIWQKSQLNS
jgi:hypothetical protein